MTVITGHNIYTGLGFGSDTVYSLAKQGITDLKRREGTFGIPDPFVASLFDRDEIDARYASRDNHGVLTYMEKAMILSAEDALSMAGVDPSSPDTIFIFSTTKGNVDLLETSPDGSDTALPLWHSAEIVARHFGNPNEPICVTNACTSGICAQIVAKRVMEKDGYVNAVVIGADFLSKFIVAGFQCLKALSPERCRPFDKDRTGLNLSEAVATIVLSSEGRGIGMELEDGCIRNDANHISAPSRTAVGQISAIEKIVDLDKASDIAFINVHGTATAYNDNMESVAIHSCGLDSLPVVSYKSEFGHTLGAAGVLETIISCLALKDGLVFPTPGYRENGVSYKLNISESLREVKGRRFLKIMSGFGGINAAVLYRFIGDE
ncbi:MAG: beta-ketoacyl synthase N-terminal-like domain-containing protein [Candidatus Cryptobacteroides sp.]